MSEQHGAPPWIPERLIEAERRRLPESVFARLFQNEWTAPEDRLVNPDDLRACTTLDGPLPPQAGKRYAIGVDIGITNDRTAVSVCHSERVLRDGVTVGHKVYLDRLQVWRGSRQAPVPLAEVEDFVATAATRYAPAAVVFDPFQAVQLSQGLQRRGIRTEQFTFSQANVGRLALNLHNLLRTHALALPDDAELLNELQRVQLRETAPNLFRIDHSSGEHDDRVIALGLAANHVTERDSGGTSAYFESLVWICPGCSLPNGKAVSSCERCATTRPAPRPAEPRAMAAPEATPPLRPSGPWCCPTCGRVEPASRTGCRVDGTPRPPESVDGDWACGHCATANPASQGHCRSCATKRPQPVLAGDEATVLAGWDMRPSSPRRSR